MVFYLYLVKTMDIVSLPKRPENLTTRRPPKKVPNWHLTSQESMEFIKEADIRNKEKENKKNKIENIKKEAVKEARKNEKKKKN